MSVQGFSAGGTLAFLFACLSIIPSSSAIAQTSSDLQLRNRIENLGITLTSEHDVPGIAIGVIRDGQLSWTLAIGFADLERKKRVTADTVFNVGSISKCVSAWGFMQLVESGKIRLDEPVAGAITRWNLPDSPFDADEVTLRRILSHTAGLSLHGYPGFSDESRLPSLEESLSGRTNGAGDVRIVSAPGTQWKYSGGGYSVAQLLLEEQTGVEFSTYMREQVLLPLGMKSSNFGWSNSPDAATPYDKDGHSIAPVRFAALAAAGLETSCHDLTRFAIASLHSDSGFSQTVLKQQTLDLMQKKVEPGSPNRSSGLGYQHMKLGPFSVMGHMGSNSGWEAALILHPETRDGLVMLTNGSNGQQVQRPIFAMWAGSSLKRSEQMTDSANKN